MESEKEQNSQLDRWLHMGLELPAHPWRKSTSSNIYTADEFKTNNFLHLFWW